MPIRKRKQSNRKPVKRAVYFDYNLLAVVIILICFGLVMLYSASAYEAANDAAVNNDDMYYFRRQAIISSASVIAALFCSRIDYHRWIKAAPIIYILSLVLMAMVRFTPFGVTVNGARRWLYLGVQFQPSELAKIAVILIMPYAILRMGRKINSLKGVVVLILIGGLQGAGAYLLTDNLSTGIIIFAISVVVIFLAHPKVRPFAIALAVLVIVVALALLYLRANISSSSSFRIRRILVWFQPENNLSAGGYQVLQGLYAIGSGGLFGKGLGNSTQKLATIPEAQNDMIFTIICEELGLFGAILVLVLFGYLLYRLFVIAQNAPDLYGTLTVSGIFVHLALQVILNICVVLNVIPTTGVTLPFVSYGGTSVMFIMLEIGIALSVSRSIQYREQKDSKSEGKETPADTNGKVTRIPVRSGT